MTTNAEVAAEARRYAMTMLTAAVAAMRPKYDDRQAEVSDAVLLDVNAVLEGLNAAVIDAQTSQLVSEDGMGMVAATYMELAFLGARTLLAQERAGGSPAEELLQRALHQAGTGGETS